jgi:catechol 2,3-dioxygenase-like lactoylglutathione lyase family enzyme
MITYATIGTNDLERAGAFYDQIAEMLGHTRMMVNDRIVTWGTPGKALFGVIKPYNGEPATGGNGTMIGLEAPSEEVVDMIHAYALANGGSDEGAPGMRGDSFYGGYFRDPDGNKLVAYLFKSA